MAEVEANARRRRRLVAIAIVAVAAAARLHGIDALDVWVDEANAILTARAPLGELFARLRLDSSPPLFFLLLHGWIALFGDGAVALRGLSVGAGVALVAVLLWAGRDLVHPRVAPWAAGFAAVAPVPVFYAQQVRPYALLALLALLSVAFLVRFLRDGRPRDRALWLAATIAALYTHNFAVYLPLVAAVLIVLSGRAVSEWKAWLACAAVGLVAWLPWLPMALAQLENPDHYAWFLADWRALGVDGVVLRTLRSFSPGAEYVKFFGVEQILRWHGWPTWLGVALAAGGAVALARGAWGLRGAVARAWPGAFWVVPVAASLLVSFLLTPHYVPGRVDQMVFPAWALLVGAGLAALRPAPLRAGVAAVVFGIALATLWTLHPEERDPRFYKSGGEVRVVTLDGGDRELARRIAARWRPGDVVLTTSLTRASLEYYLAREGREPVFVSFPRDTAAHLGSQNDARWLADRAALLREADAAVAEARERLGPGGRLFLVRARSEVNAPLKAGPLARRFGLPRIAHLGHFGQTGTGTLVELSLHAPVGDGG